MKKTIFIIVFIILIGFSVLGYFYFNKTTVKKYNGPIQKIGLKLNWVHQAEFAGHYVAEEKGFYKENGLDVNIIPFDFNTKVIDSVVKGETSFGVIGADQLLIAREQGIPVKAIAVIYKTNPATMYSLKKGGISTPSDFIGKTVGLEKGSNTVYLYKAMMSRLKIDRTKIKEVDIGFDTKEILDGSVDISTGYIINEPNLVKESGREVNTFLMADYGVNIYADVIFTTDSLIETNPDLVGRFLSATLDGWQYAIEHEKEAVDITLKYAVGSTRIHQEDMLSDSIPLINDGVSSLGWMELSEWQKTFDILLDEKILSKPINIDEVFDMQFLSNYYANKKI